MCQVDQSGTGGRAPWPGGGKVCAFKPFLIIGCILQACSFFRLASSHQELTLKKKESKMAGEQLMRLLETLDGISLGQNMLELRARRKKAAARINSLMDANDSNIQVRISKLRTFRLIF